MKALAAMSMNRIIGKDDQIPWKCSADMKWFKEFTLGHQLIVGRKTFDKLPFLSDRILWVLATKALNSAVLGRYEPYTLRICNDIDTLPKNGIVIGGAKVYESLLPYCDELYLTTIKQNVDGDTEMPAFKHLFHNEEVLHDDEERRLVRLSK